VVANHLILSGLWYISTLNAVPSDRLRQLQQLVVAFIWGARDHKVRHRVLSHIIMLPKDQGGLGLLDLNVQIGALGTQIFLWAI
jgi:hypothetical protein